MITVIVMDFSVIVVEGSTVLSIFVKREFKIDPISRTTDFRTFF